MYDDWLGSIILNGLLVACACMEPRYHCIHGCMVIPTSEWQTAVYDGDMYWVQLRAETTRQPLHVTILCLPVATAATALGVTKHGSSAQQLPATKLQPVNCMPHSLTHEQQHVFRILTGGSKCLASGREAGIFG